MSLSTTKNSEALFYEEHVKLITPKYFDDIQ